ncbi:MAG: permease-like cell division protein FtsX [Rikenellaceae bacterium]|nr:permease-like cell division protein FtsX [Rikenellaceae bacterium]
MAVPLNSRKLRRKVRNSYFISTVSIALVLFLLGAVGFLILNAVSATERMRESVTVHVMLKDGLDAEGQDAVKRQLLSREAVKAVKFVSKDEAAKEFREYIGNDFVEFLDQNPLPDAFEVTLNARSSDKAEVQALERAALGWAGVDEVVYQRNVIEQISSNLNKFNLVLLLFGGALLVIALILLNNTIRVTVFAKRYTINTMKLVGATPGFIMRPFVGSSVWQGIYAGLIASAMFAGMLVGMNEGLPELRFAGQNVQALAIMGAMLVGGVVISVIFTTFAVRKFVRMKSSGIHMY